MGVRLGGRQKGTRNKRTIAVEDTARRLGVDMFELLCLFASGDWKALGYDSEVYVKEDAKGSTTIGYTISPEMRLDATKSACKYLYSPKQSIELTTGAEGFKVIIEDYKTKA